MKTAWQYDVVIVGGGAAGFFAAINLAEKKPEMRIAIIERSAKTLQKLRISGGGRCNVTHACYDPKAMIVNYPRGGQFLAQSFARFGVAETINWFQQRGIQLKTEQDGRMFPKTDKSETIAQYFEARIQELGINLLLNVGVNEMAYDGQNWKLKTNRQELSTINVVIASGGSPAEIGYNWLKELGISIVRPVPSLFTFNAVDKAICEISGLSVNAGNVKLAGTKLSQTGPILITHWGISGPAPLKLSAFAARELAEKEYEGMLLINWLGEEYTQAKVEAMIADSRDELGNKPVHQYMWSGLPKRLQIYLLEISGIKDPLKRWAELDKKSAARLVENLTAMPLPFKGKSTNKDEFVTAGGIDLSEIDKETFKVKRQPGLYAIGEVLDIDGITGGFNFQAAWTGAMIVVDALAENE